MLPAIARFAHRIVPARIKTRLYNHEFHGKEPYFFEIGASPTARNPQYFIPYLAMYLSDFLSAFVLSTSCISSAALWICRNRPQFSPR
jgi:hypothetical protein